MCWCGVTHNWTCGARSKMTCYRVTPVVEFVSLTAADMHSTTAAVQRFEAQVLRDVLHNRSWRGLMQGDAVYYTADGRVVQAAAAVST